VFGIQGPIGHWLDATFGTRLAFTSAGASLAAGVVAFPMMVRAIRLSIEAIDPGLEAAAETLGAGRAGIVFTVTLPLALPGILTGMLLSFARSLGEFGATITFVSNIPGQTRTIPVAIYTLTQTPDGDAAALRLCIIAVILSLIALVASEWLARRLRTQLGN